MIVIALALVALMVAMFVAMEYGNKHLAAWLGDAPPDPTEDDPAFMRHVERRARHLTD